jgi:LuxR family maltose regulon positive regulatory protein
MAQEAATALWPTAKISPPHPRVLISRGRLVAQLNAAALAGRSTIVVAPGGSGKTVLLADWARQGPVPVAWYGLDRADRDLRRLLSGVLAAVERAVPGATSQALERDLPEEVLCYGSTCSCSLV